jgi:hypothetical protein
MDRIGNDFKRPCNGHLMAVWPIISVLFIFTHRTPRFIFPGHLEIGHFNLETELTRGRHILYRYPL